MSKQYRTDHAGRKTVQERADEKFYRGGKDEQSTTDGLTVQQRADAKFYKGGK